MFCALGKNVVKEGNIERINLRYTTIIMICCLVMEFHQGGSASNRAIMLDIEATKDIFTYCSGKVCGWLTKSPLANQRALYFSILRGTSIYRDTTP